MPVQRHLVAALSTALLVLMLTVASAQAQAMLGELAVEEVALAGAMPVSRTHGDMAMVQITSRLPDLQFDSNLGIPASSMEGEDGRYTLYVYPRVQYLTIAHDGYRSERVRLPVMDAREVRAYEVRSTIEPTEAIAPVATASNAPASQPPSLVQLHDGREPASTDVVPQHVRVSEAQTIGPANRLVTVRENTSVKDVELGWMDEELVVHYALPEKRKRYNVTLTLTHPDGSSVPLVQMALRGDLGVVRRRADGHLIVCDIAQVLPANSMVELELHATPKRRNPLRYILTGAALVGGGVITGVLLSANSSSTNPAPPPPK